MALHAPQPPAASRTAAREGIDRLVDSGVIPPFARARSGTDLDLTRPRELYQLGRAELLGDAGLAAARPVLWRYVVELGDEDVALADTQPEPDGTHVLGQVNYGPFVAGIAQALRVAEGAEREVDAESRLLHVPALHLIAVWLRATTGEDRLIPADPAPEGIDAGRLYRADTLLPTLTTLAAALPEPITDDARGG
ncbi:hypothetical protein [Streptomyces sp. NPDC057702]|uniref:hypothetical protein n=1 Tax=unclassified Streptomyces TaxID=2593676 RepID=UPI0036C95E08